jgi:hypothetical protein
VHIDGSFEAAIHEGVRRGYTDGYLRKSIVADPLRRGNTGDNSGTTVDPGNTGDNSGGTTVDPGNTGDNSGTTTPSEPTTPVDPVPPTDPGTGESGTTGDNSGTTGSDEMPEWLRP